MRKKLLTCIVAILSMSVGVVSCSSETSSQHDGVKYTVTRNQFNELAITVTQAPKGEADHVLFKLQCYHMAKDRLFQMDIARRVGLGRLSEIYASTKAQEKDAMVIAVGLRHSAYRKLERIKNEFPLEYSHLYACADGVNQYIAELVDKGTSEPSSPERRLLDYYRDAARTNDPSYVPAAWAVVDIIATVQNVTFYLSSRLQQKLTLGELALQDIYKNMSLFERALEATGKQRLASKLGFRTSDPHVMPETVRGMFDLRPIYTTAVLDSDPLQNPLREHIAAKQHKERLRAHTFEKSAGDVSQTSPRSRYDCHDFGYPMPECPKDRGMSIGSNNWVLGQSMTGDGTVRLMNDTHLQLSYPMNFYAVALDSTPAANPNDPNEGYKGRGLQIPGVPGWLIGHNRSIAWGLTNHGADVDDLRLEKVTEDGKSVIFVKDGIEHNVPIESEVVTVRHRMTDGSLKDVPVTYRWTAHHGPVVSDGMEKFKEFLPDAAKHYQAKSMVITYAWTGHEGTWTDLPGRLARGSETVAQLRLDRAENFEQLKQAIRNMPAGAQNIVYGDTKGNIGYYTYGLFPVRDYAAEWSPLYPTLGQGQFEWGPSYREQIPELYNPDSGKIVTANNDAFGINRTGIDQDYQGIFNTGSRAYRINELLDKYRGRLDEKTNAKIQFDHVDRTVTAFLGLLTRGLNLNELGEAEINLYNQIKDFDGNMEHSKTTPVLVASWLDHLQDAFIDAAFAPELHEKLQKLKEQVELTTTTYHYLATGDAGAVGKVLRESLRRTAEDALNRGLTDYRWGEVHRIGLWNPLEGIAKRVLSLNLPRDGFFETIDVATDTVGPNFRAITTLHPDGRIDYLISLPGGNYDPRDRAKIYAEFERWNSGQYRQFVDYTQ